MADGEVAHRQEEFDDDRFYRAFEDEYRGSRETIRSRLRVYLPFIEPLRLIQADASAVDLGCGRGEWLELLGEAGFDARGVDLDEGMLAPCREIGLAVTKGDALTFLRGLSDASQMIVTGFHIAEHLCFSDLRLLVQEALRVLRPAGLLILETPNPENLRVGATSFYLDPTHQHPLPPGLLSFLPKYYGFARVKVIRLQEPRNLLDGHRIALSDVLSGVSPDYAVIAQKTAEASVMTATGRAFEPEYGLTLEALVGRFDQQMADQAQALEVLQSEAAANSSAFARVANAWEGMSTALAKEFDQKSETIASCKAEVARLRANEESLKHQLAALRSSPSWRVTAPLRFAGRTLRGVRDRVWGQTAIARRNTPED